jgi:hypothetical protein
MTSIDQHLILNLDIRPIIANINQPPLIRSSILNDSLPSETNGTNAKSEHIDET